MVLGLGGCCGGVAVAAVSPAAGRKQSESSGDGAGYPELEAKQQKTRVAGEESSKAAGAGKQRKKRDHEKAPVVVMHQFPFHSRPGLL